MARMEDDSYQKVFADMIQAPEGHLIQAQLTNPDLDSEVQIDEDGIPF